jgi:uncharacterized damage-inducible protein DinB
MPDHLLLESLLDSWNRNNAITTNLLRAIPDGAMDLKATPTSPTIAQLFMHMHYCRMVFVEEDAPEIAVDVPKGEWGVEYDRDRLATLLATSAKAVRDAVVSRLDSGRAMDRHYDHPILMLQHFIWHEGYHQGQIKVALKMAGRAFDDEEIGAVTWDVWMGKAHPT